MTSREERSFTTRRRLALGLALLLAAGACRPAPPPEEQDHSTSPTEAVGHAPQTLKTIMQGLEADMAAAAHGLWIGDRDAVAAAAGRIADHPHVTPEQMGVIQATLGDEFAAFVAHDQGVHGLAVAFAEAATDSTADLASAYTQVQAGCLACHDAFRDRLLPALSAGGAE